MRMLVVLSAGLLLVTCSAAAAGPVHVSLAGGLPAPTLGQPWTAKLAVRPRSFRGPVRITAAGPGRIAARATRVRSSYRARIVFPATGRWRLTARAGGSSSHLGTVTVRRPPPLRFAWPTSVDVQPDGSLLVVENGRGRVLAVSPARGGMRVRAAGLAKPFAAVTGPSGSVYISDGPSLRRLDGSGSPQTVATAGEDIGPIAIARDGAVLYATATRLFRLPAVGGVPQTIATGLGNPHGVAVAADGATLVSDTANDRVLRVDANGGVSTLIQTGQPRGLDVAADGTISVVEATTKRIGRFRADGTRLGDVGPVFRDPYDVVSGRGRVLFVVETAASGVIRRVASDGTTLTIPTG